MRPRMYARLISTVPGVGDLALVEVPPNCTIREADARKAARIQELTQRLAARFQDAEGTSAYDDLLDELAGWVLR
jgi:hypothetical protein